jgi:glycosyltransferase involved in cell wall biosynthesis
MKVVVLSETYAPDMGYLTTMLPRFMAREGAEVHLVVLDLAAYHYLPDFEQTYGRFLQRGSEPGAVREVDGYQVHVLRHRRTLGFPRAVGLHDKLRELRPDVVYSSVAVGWLPLQAAFSRLTLGYRLFTGSHTAAILFPLARMRRPFLSAAGLRSMVTRWLPGRLVSLVTELCYAPTSDCGEIAWRFFGVQRRKVRVVHLGVDTDVFHPAGSAKDLEERAELRAALGFAPQDTVCVYSGKMTEAKNALIVAQAIEQLRGRGLPFRGLFIGDGLQRESIARFPSCVLVDFMPYRGLGRYYRAADIGVWPTIESTSMLDAAACALPLVVSDVIYRDHVEGNGRVYRTNDLADMVRVLEELADPALRARLGAAGAAKMVERFNWQKIAAGRLDDFASSLRAGSVR